MQKFPRYLFILVSLLFILFFSFSIYQIVQCLNQKGIGEKGVNPDLPKIIDISWEHGETINFDEFYKQLYYEKDPEEVYKESLLTVYFNQELNGINRQTFQVQIDFPQLQPSSNETYQFLGMYNLYNLRLYGHIVPLAGPHITPHTNETSKWAATFIPHRDFFDSNAINYLRLAWVGNRRFGIDLPCVYITIKGDLIWAGDKFEENAILDANNIGGQVGINKTRGGVISGSKNPSGNMVIGGYFESWFFLDAPREIKFPD